MRNKQAPPAAAARKPTPTRLFTCLMRLALLFILLGGLALFSFVLAQRWLNSQVALTPAPGLNLVERIYLQSYFARHSEALQQPAATATTAVRFEIAAGETAELIAANLVRDYQLQDTELFLNYVRFVGLDNGLAAGTFLLQPGLTVPQLADSLTQVRVLEVELTFLAGWRLEEILNYLSVLRPAQIDPAQFQAIVQRQTDFDLTPYDFLVALPPAATLEGFLFPDSYIVPVDADAFFLVDLMLRNFGAHISPALRQAFGQQGLTVPAAVTLAAIVEREAVLAVERPLIAAVFLNRLAANDRLQADPTVQYALGYQASTDSWWKSPLSLRDLEVDSPYNTYLHEGLPPGPIANPGLASLEAVAFPAETDFYFFVADCTTAARDHLFAVTFAEHLANVEQCE